MGITGVEANKRLRLFLQVAACSLICVLVSCDRGLERLKSETRRFEREYCSPDILEAEKALIGHKARIVRMKEEKVRGINYDSVLAIANARHSYVHFVLDREEEAVHFYMEATKHMGVGAKSEGRQYVNPTRDEVYRLVRHADSYLDVKWRASIKDRKQ